MNDFIAWPVNVFAMPRSPPPVARAGAHGVAAHDAAARFVHRCATGASATANDLLSRLGRASGRAVARDGMLAVAVLPFEPQRLAPWRRQWFEGWFIRFVDHAAGLSVALILGSMRLPGRSASAAGAFDEHLLVLAFSDASGHHSTGHVVVGEREAVLLGGGAGPLPASLSASAPPRWEWRSQANGFIRGSGDALSLDVTVDGARLVANISAPRVPWSESAPNRAGPEGWLGRTGLLPCHYFVHSFASPAAYELSIPELSFPAGRRTSRSPAASSAGAASRPGVRAGARGQRRTLRGVASTHVERNYGDAFPLGWVWAQVCIDTYTGRERCVYLLDVSIWPLQDVVLLQSFVMGVNHPFIAPPHLQSLPYCNTTRRPLRNIRPPTDCSLLCHTPCTIGDGNIV